MKRIASCFFVIIWYWPFYLQAQNLKLTLTDAIELAKKNSLEYKIATNTARSAFWDYQAYKSGFLPKLSLNGTLPDYYRTINSITLPNGQKEFVGQNLASSGLSMNISQNISLTGGSIAVGSSLQRIDNFGTNGGTSYTSVPLTINYTQPSFFYNEFKWQRKIQPIRFTESKRQYLETMEGIAYNTIQMYFDLLKATVQLRLDDQNLKNIDTLVKITQARFEIGTVQLNEILQSKVSLLNAKKALLASTLTLETARQNFIRYLNLSKSQYIELAIPDSLMFFKVDYELALKQAFNNRKFVSEFERRKLQAEQEIEKVRSLTGPTISLRANLGLTQTGKTLNNSYEQLLRNQLVAISFNIPLIDWNVNRSNRKRADANLELEKNYIDQQQLSAEQEITSQVIKWNMQEEKIQIARLTKELALQRYGIAKQKYTIGSISFTDFNNAQIEKDRAEMDYANSFLDYWTSYYLIRKLTLYDFTNGQKIETNETVSSNVNIR